MKKIVALALLAALAFVSPAVAGGVRLTATVNGSVVYNLTSTIPDADLARLVAWAKLAYGQVPSGSVDANGNPILRDRTNAEAIDAWWRGILAGTKANIENFEKAAAQQAITAAPVTVGVPQ